MSIAVFASGSGSNFEELVHRSREENWPEQVTLLVCDKPGAGVLERADRLGVPARVFEPKSYPDKAAYERDVLALLTERGIRWVVLAGYMRLVGPTLLKAYPWRIINLHPSLLPAFKGKQAIEQAFHHPVKISGVTVHFVDEGLDTGPIIDQLPVRIEPADTLERFAEKIHRAEHELLPRTVRRLITGEIPLPDQPADL
ncbi:phosphoribosylglycinamide formyltransferase [Staphylospora marina]|uniref:phosphoribosylglycinamide formyltransferase n=1 Tax=Staphylospora marina TaxID=2490858 RepID=UPI000F5BCB07|nr:phosphoribosylglycinamide formyltransferase [Staphylospora marina]